MPDLIEKFYREDLTEAEEQALGETLSTSEDAAEKFGALAEATYYRFGHPKPEWPGGDSLPRSKGGWKPWLWMALLAAVGGAALWIFLHRQAVPETSVSAVLQPMVRVLAALMKDVRDDLLAPSGLTTWARAQRTLQPVRSTAVPGNCSTAAKKFVRSHAVCRPIDVLPRRPSSNARLHGQIENVSGRGHGMCQNVEMRLSGSWRRMKAGASAKW